MITAKLLCDYMENPIGFDFDRPTLSWRTTAEGRNKAQSAFQVQVALEGNFAAPLFDSGKVASDESTGYRLEMKLDPTTRYDWRVKVWDEQDVEGDFSEAAHFETARYGRAWKADWIGASADLPQLRRGFVVERPVRRARAYVCGVGLYRLFINGEPATSELLTPNFNAYDLWLQYQTYDVTGLIAQGDNAVGAWLGNGYYKGRVNWPGIPYRDKIYGDQAALIMELDIEYEDGTRETVMTDTGWKSTASPYLRAEIYDGEVFDARAFDRNWARPGLDDAAWAPVQVVSIDKSLLHARKSVPVEVMETLPVKEKILTPAGEQVFDFGQNFAGRLRVTLNAPAGTEVLFQFGESLEEHGNFYRENMRTALAEMRIISDGTLLTYAANFTFFGFRYVRVTGLEMEPGDMLGEVMYSHMETIGHFECSDPRVNRLFLNALWGQKSNFVDTPTDCPQRDERMGWTGDAQVFCPTACMNMNADAFFRKYLYDLALEQKKMGYVPVVVPFIVNGTGIWEFPTTGWGDAATLMPWNLYLHYADKAVLEAQYDSMKDWVEYMRAQDTAGNDLYEGFHIGDWLAQDTKDPDNFFGLTPTSLVATAYYAWSCDHVTKAARVLGLDEDAREYEALAARVREAFRREFVSPAGRVSSETQTAYVLALNMDMLTDDQRDKAIACLAERIEIDNVHLTTGFLGTPYLCSALSDAGLDEYAYSLLLSTGFPSWLYPVEMGATTIWERWNSIREDGTMGAVNMNSLNHYAFGAVAEWLYRYVAGLNPVEQAPGYRRARVRPHINDMLSNARAEIDTPYGRLASSWQLDGDRLCVEVTVPFGARAEICLPDAKGMPIEENGQPVEPASYAEGCAVVERGSGTWRYTYMANGQTIHKRIVEKPVPRY